MRDRSQHVSRLSVCIHGFLLAVIVEAGCSVRFNTSVSVTVV